MKPSRRRYRWKLGGLLAIAALALGSIWEPVLAQETGHGGRTLAEWRTSLADPSPMVRRQALAALPAFEIGRASCRERV